MRSLPVVSLTAAFGGLVFGFQTYIGFHRYIGHGSEAYGGPIISLGLAKELIPILVGLDGLGPRRLVHGGRDRDDEDHRTDRRPVQPRGRSQPLPGRAPDAGRVLHAALPDPLRGHHRDPRRRISTTSISWASTASSTSRTRCSYLELWDVASGLIKACGLRCRDRHRRLLAGAEDRGRRRGGRPGDDADGRHRQHHHPDPQLFPEQGAPGDTQGGMIQIIDLHKSFGPKKVLRGVDLDDRDGRDDGRHRPERLGKERPAQAPDRPPQARQGRDLSSTDWRSRAPRRRARCGSRGSSACSSRAPRCSIP